jgi:predicted enzyme related to lactoylglutathione lyase
MSEGRATVPVMSLSLAMITVNTLDAESLAAWWAAQLGAETLETNEGWYVTLGGDGMPVRLSFQKVDDPTPGRNKLHLDLLTEDLDAETVRLVEAGATEVEQRSIGDFRWVTLADPDGNEFCVAGKQ